MLSRKTKKSKRNGAVAPLLIWLLGISTFALWHSVSTPSFAAETEDPVGVVVTGVANVTEYLTSLVLYSNDPQSKTAVVLRYDADLNGLVVDSAVNADALSVGSGNVINGTGSAILGGEKNEVKSENANYYVILGGKKNLVTLNARLTGNVIVAGSGAKFDGTLGTNSYSLIIGGNNAGYAGSFQVYLGGNGSRNSFSDNYTLSLGTGGNIISADSVLMGEKIKGGVAGNNTNKYSNIFVWSDTGSFSPNASSAFYVNAQSGFGLNTNNPRMTLDIKNSGILLIEKNTSLTSSTLVECKEASKGTIVYISRTSGTTNVAGICGCNGTGWVPFSIDPIIQSVCNKNASTLKCLGTVNNVDKGSVNGVMRWYSDANNGNGDWSYPYWTYGGKESLNGGDRECSYTCKCSKTGKCYHPNVENPIGWFTGSCVECTDIENKQEWILSGNGVDNCTFNCKAGYKYNELDRTCTTCLIGERTPAKNQSGSCARCDYPKGISNNGRVTTGGILYDGTPYFLDFTSVGTGGNKTSCKFTCLSGFKVSSSNYSCTQCINGEWSNGGDATSCESCTNHPDGISFKRRFHDSDAWSNGVVGNNDVFSYTSFGSNGPLSCEWDCNSDLGLVRYGDQCICKDSVNNHLEVINNVTQCVPNVKNLDCIAGPDGIPGAGTLKGQGFSYGVGGYGMWNEWTWNGVKWNFVPYEAYALTHVLGDCEWTCPKNYHKVGNVCEPPAPGVCASSLNNKYISSSTDLTHYSSSSLCDTSYGVKWLPLKIEYDFTFKPSDGSFNGPTEAIPARWGWHWACLGEVPESYTDCVAYVTGAAQPGVCDLTKGEPACVLNHLDLHKPVLTGYAQYGDGRTWTEGSTNKWLKWQCPGLYGGDFVHCGICDNGYSFNGYSTGDQKCYSNTRINDCFKGDNGLTTSILNSSNGYVYGTGKFTQTLDTSTFTYTPETKWTYTSNKVDQDGGGNNTCKYTCATGYTVNDENKCIANTYTIEYYLDGTKIGESTHVYDSAKRLTSFGNLGASKTGFPSFAGWAESDKNVTKKYDNNVSVINLTAENNGVVKLYAIMYREATFTAYNTKKAYQYNNHDYCSVNKPAVDTSIDGWSFLGWRTDASASTSQLTIVDTLNGYCGKDFNAVYSRTANFYSGISGTKKTSTQYYNRQGNYYVSVPSGFPSSVTSWTTLGWKGSTTASSEDYSSTVTYLTASSQNYYSVYKRTVKLQYNGNGGSGTGPSSSQQIQYFNSTGAVSSVTFTLANNTYTKAGYTFSGWDLGGARTTHTWSPGVSASATITATAQWTTQGYTISYSLGGGTNHADNPSSYNVQSDTITLKDPTRNGYDFIGWTGDNGNTPKKGVTIDKGSTGNKSYTANWELKTRDCGGSKPTLSSYALGASTYKSATDKSWQRVNKTPENLGECEYNCASNYTWNSTLKICESKTKDKCGSVGVDYKNGNIYLSDGSHCIVLKDKNVGATSTNTSSTNSLGNYFQWGNNYRFPNASSATVTTTNTQADVSSNGPGNYYSSSSFYVDPTEAVVSDIAWYSKDSDGHNNRNLWGGALDLLLHQNGMNENVYRYSRPSDRRGPCDSGFHVPANIEWNQAFDIFCNISANDCTMHGGGPLDLEENDEVFGVFKRFANALYVNKSLGLRYGNEVSAFWDGELVGFWTSTPEHTVGYNAKIFTIPIVRSAIYYHMHYDYTSVSSGLPVRCFSDDNEIISHMAMPSSIDPTKYGIYYYSH